MKKRAMAMFLGLTMALSLSIPAFAAPATPVPGKVTDNKDGTQSIGGVNTDEAAGFGQGSDVKWEAEVVAGDVISVVMPTSVDFFIKLKDAGYTAGGSDTQMGYGGVLSGGAKIINNSTCPVELSCVGITDGGITSDAATSAGNLPSKVLDLVQLALAANDPNKDPELSDKDFTAKKLDAAVVTADAPIKFGSIAKPTADDAEANILTLWMNGKKLTDEGGATWFEVMKAVAADETITATVTTTLKVSVAAVQAPIT